MCNILVFREYIQVFQMYNLNMRKQSAGGLKILKRYFLNIINTKVLM